MSLKLLEDEGIIIDWKPWKMPGNALPQSKPEGYGESAKIFLNYLLEKTGLSFNPPLKKRDTFYAHVGGKFAKEQGVFKDYHNRIFKAVWVRNEDVGDFRILCTIAKEVGLDVKRFEKSLDDVIYQESVENDFEEASLERVWTIPTYIGDQGEIQVHHFKDIPMLNQLRKLCNREG